MAEMFIDNFICDHLCNKIMNKRYRIFFSGTVQGVGFRYTARDLADKYNLKGWVANLSDSRVELDAEGPVADLNNFLKDLKEEFKSYIRNIDLEELSYSDEYKNFYIKLY